MQPKLAASGPDAAMKAGGDFIAAAVVADTDDVTVFPEVEVKSAPPEPILFDDGPFTTPGPTQFWAEILGEVDNSPRTPARYSATAFLQEQLRPLADNVCDPTQPF